MASAVTWDSKRMGRMHDQGAGVDYLADDSALDDMHPTGRAGTYSCVGSEEAR